MGRTLTGGSQLPFSPPPAVVGKRIRGDLFIAADLAAAELLVHLSESSAEAAASSVSSSAFSSSPRSVDMRPPLPPSLPEAVLVGNEEEEEEMGPWRRTKRYRLIADLYAATRPVGGGGGEEKPRPRPRRP